jgi:hypothetical protein
MLSRLAGALAALVLLAGCAHFNPHPIESQSLRDKAREQAADGLTVRAYVLSAKEAKGQFGAGLHDKGIQPIWIEIENRTPRQFWFLAVGVDREYYPATEAAYRTHRFAAPRTNERIDGYFRNCTLERTVPPHSTNAGFVFAQFVRGAKAFNVDLAGEDQVRSFPFVQEVPGFKADFNRVDLERLYRADAWRSVTAEELRRELESMPPSTTSSGGRKPGDPLNIVIIGTRDSLLRHLVGAGWHLTEANDTGSFWRTFKAFLLGSPYQTAPVSSLYVFGRRQDIALQKPRHSIQQRNHLRLWLAPLRFEGQPVWVGQISRDMGIRFTPRTWHLSTHTIAPDVDESRDYLLADLSTSQALSGVGWVRGVGAASPEMPRRNLTGDRYYTDGLRVVLRLAETGKAGTIIDRFPWETPPMR